MASTMTHRFRSETLLMARLRLGLTQRQVSVRCEELGHYIDFGNLSRYERGKFVPSPKALPVLAKALGLTVDELFEPVSEGDAA